MYRVAIASFLFVAQVALASQVQVSQGTLEGTESPDQKIAVYLGIPYAAPPVGELRWKAPQPAPSWQGVRKATEFGARCMQARLYDDMIFRDNGPNEDCLYLNVWTPAREAGAKLPVMVWIYGGGFQAGAASEPRQDGTELARKGVLVVSLNYRLGIFGFLAHPALTKESGHNSSGNYGLMDQAAALRWVQQNIQAFGGDPANVTIFGESAGSFSVSALMASPLSRDLIARAIGESGAFFGSTLGAKSRTETEAKGQQFGETIGANSIEALRAKPAMEVLAASVKQRGMNFGPNVDGYFLPEEVPALFASGKQSHVPLLAGWNADEGSYRAIFGKEPPTALNYPTRIKLLFREHAEAILKAYPARTDAEAKRSAQDLAGDQFIGYSTWKWLQAQNATGKSPVYRYRFEEAPPLGVEHRDADAAYRGAYHSAEIEFVFGALTSKKLPWRQQDFKLSELMMTYWSNFAKKGDPSANGLPRWPVYQQSTGFETMHLNADSHSAPEQNRDRYELLDTLNSTKTVNTP